MKSKLKTGLSSQQKSQFYKMLFQFDQAGLTLHHACELMKKADVVPVDKLGVFTRQINQGKTLSEAGFKARLVSSDDRYVLNAGESAGKLTQVLENLADYYSTKTLHTKRIKKQLILPIGILVLFNLLQPLVALVTGKFSGLDYIVTTLITLIKLMMALVIVFNFSTLINAEFSKKMGLKQLFLILQFKLPIVNRWVIQRQVNSLLTYLALLLNAGVPMLEAFPKALDTIKNPLIKKQFEPTVERLNQGHAFADALQDCDLIPNTTKHHIAIGDSSGRLDQTLTHISHLESKSIASRNEMIVEWVPRLIYLCVIAYVGYSLVSGTTLISVPNDF